MKLNFIGRLTGAALITALAAWTGCSSTSNKTVPLSEFNCPAAQTLCGDAASATCADLRKDAANCGACGTACKDGEVCSAGRCEISCGPGLSECSGACTNVKADAANCGACGTTCGASEVCSNGACAANCQPGLTDCVGSCVNTKSDVYNGGGCDVIFMTQVDFGGSLPQSIVTMVSKTSPLSLAVARKILNGTLKQ